MLSFHLRRLLVTTVKELGLLVFLIMVVMLTHMVIIAYDMIYPEQSYIYSANAHITSWLDLLKVYFSPQMLHLYIPFFRPSGHFLIYQLLTPFIGWYNTRALIVINLLFLSGCGYLLIKIYPRLFPGYRMGGYLAFAIFMLHPALALAKLIALHFEFAYIFFSLLTLFCFIVYCQRNLFIDENGITNCGLKTRSNYLLIAITIFYFLACTFKESGVMVMPVLGVYLLLFYYQGGSLRTYGKQLWHIQQVRQLIALFFCLFVIMSTYLTLAWPTLTAHVTMIFSKTSSFAAVNEFFKVLFGVQYNLIPATQLDKPQMLWRGIVWVEMAKYTIGVFVAALIFICSLFLIRKNPADFIYKRSLSFLLLATILFLIIPLAYGMGLPWHLNMMLTMFCLALGFSADFLLNHLRTRFVLYYLLIFIIVTVLHYLTIETNVKNVERYQYHSRYGLALRIDQNALLNPPPIQKQLNADSVLVIQDNIVNEDYLLGGIYPYFYYYQHNYSYYSNLDPQLKQTTFLYFDPTYSGTLFKWAYGIPTLREELYPFDVHKMDKLKHELIYGWLQHLDNIFCIGYDSAGNWHDLTSVFRRNLVLEQQKRHLRVHSYNESVTTRINGTLLHQANLPYPDPTLCQFACDQDITCGGFVYVNVENTKQALYQCQFMTNVQAAQTSFCAACTSYSKIR